MVKHIVLYTFKEGVDKADAVKLIASVLEPLVGKIPGLLNMEILSTAWTTLCIRSLKARKP